MSLCLWLRALLPSFPAVSLSVSIAFSHISSEDPGCERARELLQADSGPIGGLAAEPGAKECVYWGSVGEREQREREQEREVSALDPLEQRV